MEISVLRGNTSEMTVMLNCLKLQRAFAHAKSPAPVHQHAGAWHYGGRMSLNSQRFGYLLALYVIWQAVLNNFPNR